MPGSIGSRLSLIGALGFLCIGGGAAVLSAAAEKATTRTVVIEGLKFEPETLTVALGDTVVWVNKDPFPHTATARGVFDSREIAPDKSWKFTPRRAGDYEYVCTFHSNMKGTLIVK